MNNAGWVNTIVWPVTLMPMLLIAGITLFQTGLRRGIVFGITVPLDWRESAPGRQITRTYFIRCGVAIVASLIVAVTAIVAGNAALLAAAIPVELISAYVLWLQARRQTRPYATRVPLVRTAELGSDAEGTGGLVAQALALLLPLGTFLYLRAHWTEIPLRFATHWNSAGQADRWQDRTPAGVYAPLLFGAGMVLLFLAMSTVMRASRQGGSARMPAILAVFTWALALFSCERAVSPLLPGFPPVAVPAGVLIVILVAGWMIWRMRRLQQNEGDYDGTPDNAWRWGGFVYYNPADQALLVPKRYGWGWTWNMARPMAWAWIGGVLTIAAVMMVVVSSGK